MSVSRDKESKRITFWTLINDWKITIPQLQREYAQGRNEEAPNQIREGLLNDMRKALVENGGEMILNFVYGKTDKEKKEFEPVDGQQRLTTLFLVHYYFFCKCEDLERLEVLSRFSYKTRDTSRRFCEDLCHFYGIDFNKMCNKDEGVLSSQIMNQSWFTGNMKKDPTVDSMLRMLDEIHRFFKNENAQEIRDKLVSKDEMPISFLWLKMEEFQKSDDLYIKMNARGKILSDFEIFKAKLQGSKVLDKIVKKDGMTEEDIQAAKILFISDFNNQFIELFFSYFKIYSLNRENGNIVEYKKQFEVDKLDATDKANLILQPQLSIESADQALMDFIRNFVRNDYFVKMREMGKDSRKYRNNYLDIVEMKSGSFFRFIERGTWERLVDDLGEISHEVIENAIKKVSNILALLAEKFEMDETININTSLSKTYFSEEEVLQTKIPYKTTLKDDVIAYSLFGYWLKFGIPKTMTEIEAYSWWKRIVYNIAEHANLRSNENAVFTMYFFSELLNKISAAEKDELLKELANSDINAGGAALQYVLPEEVCKAKLIISDLNWLTLILEAEDYFTDGSIGFLLRGASSTNDYENVNFTTFSKMFEMAKRLFASDKSKQNEIKNELEKALLCMPDEGRNGEYSSYLKPGNDSYSWCFYGSDFKDYLQNDKAELQNKQTFINQLLKLLISEEEILENNGQVEKKNISELLQMVISKQMNTATSLDGCEWKKYFIDSHSLFDINTKIFNFKKAIAFVEKEVLLLTTTTVRGYSMELYTYLLFDYAESKGKQNIKLYPKLTSELFDNILGFPCRHFTIGDKKIGYYQNKYYVEDADGISIKNENEVKEIIDSM